MTPTNTSPGQTSLEELIQLLDLERIETNLFRGQHPASRKRRLFGGQIISQSVMAAARTVDEAFHPHSLHAYFLRPGDWRLPALFEVDRIRDGRSFVTRRVKVIQNGQAIFNMDASFHVREPGLAHQFKAPPAYAPPDEASMSEGLKKRPFLGFQVDYKEKIKPVPQAPEQYWWIKANGPVPDDPLLHLALLAYQSDEALLGTARLPHRGSYDSGKLQVASLDHSLWFHHDINVSDWLLYALDSPNMGHGRGYTRGESYTAEGKLVASCMQEGLIRQLD